MALSIGNIDQQNFNTIHNYGDLFLNIIYE